MKTLKAPLDIEVKYPLEKISRLEDILFFDIETTGFSPKTSQLYLIGCAFYADKSWHTIQWFAENPEEEIDIITAFFWFAGNYKCLIHFNGNTFDLPFLLQKCTQYDLAYSFEGMKNVDLYKCIAPCKFFLKVPNCKQKTLEQFLGIHREDPYSGGELIQLYREYIKSPSEHSEKAILLHNKEDIIGLLNILPMLSYYDLFTQNITVKKVQANYYRDFDGTKRMELLMTVTLPIRIPQAVSACTNQCYFSGNDSTGTLKVPVYEEEMKYFYANYKDYYYLPTEDVALHKSVATFVDSEHRIPATASTCYTRKYSQYLPQWGMFIEPFFKRDYKCKEIFFELTDELKKDREAFSAYANHVLAMIATTY